MAIEITDDGLLTELWAINNEQKQVFPHLKSKRGGVGKGLQITLTGRKEDYHLVGLDQFINHIARGDFNDMGRVRMRPRTGCQSNGYAVRKASMSQKLFAEVEKRRKQPGYIK